MKSDLIAAYAALTIKNTYEAPISKDDNPLTIKIGGKDFVFDRIDDSEKDTDSGYQGHIYRNPSNGDIIVVHEGSIPLGEKSRFPLEVVRRVGKNELPTIYKISETTYQIDDSDLMSVNNNA